MPASLGSRRRACNHLPVDDGLDAAHRARGFLAPVAAHTATDALIYGIVLFLVR